MLHNPNTIPLYQYMVLGFVEYFDYAFKRLFDSCTDVDIFAIVKPTEVNKLC
jgi:hypothetical protein